MIFHEHFKNNGSNIFWSEQVVQEQFLKYS